MRYSYKAISQAGAEVSGVIDADSPEEAEDKLAARDLIPRSVKAGSRGARGDLGERIRLWFARVKTPDLVIFSKQFRTLFNAGIPMTNLLEILEQQTENPRLRRAAARMAGDVQAGRSLTEAFQGDPGVFSPLYSSMIRAGETSGRLVEVMDRLIYLLQHEHKVKSDIKSALQYPALVVVALVAAFMFLLTFVIPRFATIFENAKIELPLPTRICLLLHQWIIVYWPLTLAVLLALILAAYFALKTDRGRYAKDYLLLKMPILGPVFQKAAMSRFASMFSILQASGISVLDALEILSGTIGNKAVSREFGRVQEQLRQGRSISEPLGNARFFTPMVVNMVAIGEESGNLDEVLGEVSRHYDDEVEYSVGRMAETVGPILVVALAAVVGFFALAIFLPMWDLVKVV